MTNKLSLAAMIVAAIFTIYVPRPAFAQNDLCVRYADRPVTLPQPASIEGSTPYIYKSIRGIDLRLHVFNPPTHRASVKLPAIVLFFGGGWSIGTVMEPVPQATYLAGRGMVAIIADYRVFCRYGTGVTDEMADAKSAIRWVRSHADELGIDPGRIAASGGSSGGHLALSTAMFDDFDDATEDRTISSKPTALVLSYPCVDETSDEERRDFSAPLGNHGQDVSPLYHIVRGLPPTIILQGTADSLYGSAKKYCTTAKTFGNECDFFEYDGAPHAFFSPRINQGNWYREALLEADRFLTRLGYLPGPSPAQLP